MPTGRKTCSSASRPPAPAWRLRSRFPGLTWSRSGPDSRLSHRFLSCPDLRARAFFFLSRVDAILLPEMRIAPARRTALSGGILLLLALPSCRGTGHTPAGPRFERAPVILISVDTLRSDRLPMYGYRKLEAPALDRLRSEGILFERAYAHIPLTLPSHVSLFTGLEPGRHGVLDNACLLYTSPSPRD